MTDEQILAVIARPIINVYGPYGDRHGNDASGNVAPIILDALHDAGLEVGPADTFKLGRAVAKVKPRRVGGLRGEEREQALTINDMLRFIYAEAGVERP